MSLYKIDEYTRVDMDEIVATDMEYKLDNPAGNRMGMRVYFKNGVSIFITGGTPAYKRFIIHLDARV